MKRLKFSLLLLFLSALSFPARAAVVFLKDGRQLQGTVVSATARDVQLHTEEGTLRIDAEKILRIDYAETAPAAPPAAPPAATPPHRARPVDAPAGPLNQIFSFGFGLATPLNSVDPASTGGNRARNGDTGVRLGVQYLYDLSPRLSAGLDVHYFNRSVTDDFGFVPSGHSEISGRTFMPLAVLKYALTDDGGPTRPYFLAGVGAHRTSLTINTQPLEGFTWSDTGTWETRRLVDDTHWGLASRAALGLDFFAMDPVTMSFEIGWMGLHGSRYKGTVAGQDVGLDSVTGSLNALNVALQWGWRF